MARVIFSVFCRSASVDRFTNNLSLFDVIEGLNIQAIGDVPEVFDKTPSLPGLDAAHIVLFMRNDPAQPESPTVRVTLQFPNGSVLAGPEQELDLKTSETSRLLTRFNGLPYAGNGTYRLLTQMKSDGQWTTLHEYPINVQLSIPPASAQQH
jgi:hypothetical protein